MKAKTILVLLLAIFSLFPGPAFANSTETDPDMRRYLSLGAWVGDAQTEWITYSPDFEGVMCILDITSGTTLLIDLNMEAYGPGGNPLAFASDIPSANGITGVSTTRRVFHPFGPTTGQWTSTVAAIPRTFRLMIDSNNGNAYTFTLDCMGMN